MSHRTFENYAEKNCYRPIKTFIPFIYMFYDEYKAQVVLGAIVILSFVSVRTSYYVCYDDINWLNVLLCKICAVICYELIQRRVIKCVIHIYTFFWILLIQMCRQMSAVIIPVGNKSIKILIYSNLSIISMDLFVQV